VLRGILLGSVVRRGLLVLLCVRIRRVVLLGVLGLLYARLVPVVVLVLGSIGLTSS